MPWPLHWLQDTGTAALGLRRYTSTVNEREDPGWCPDNEYSTSSEFSYHSAFAWLGQRQQRARVETEHGVRYESAHDLFEIADDDPRWPTHCTCGRAFTDDDERQQWAEEIFIRTDTGAEVTTHSTIVPDDCELVSPGAVQDLWWYARFDGSDGSLGLNPDRPKDGIIVGIHCPYMDERKATQVWCVDQRATGESAGFWTRTGDPRNPSTFNATPSIAIGVKTGPGYYHGFAQNGVLTDHIG
jgi:hypothetical protein